MRASALKLCCCIQVVLFCGTSWAAGPVRVLVGDEETAALSFDGVAVEFVGSGSFGPVTCSQVAWAGSSVDVSPYGGAVVVHASGVDYFPAEPDLQLSRLAAFLLLLLGASLFAAFSRGFRVQP